MKKEISVSLEKRESHLRINELIFKWIDVQNDGIVITMPADSGRQENDIIRQIHKTRSRVKLKTFDKFLNREETGIYDPLGVWEHHKGDVLKLTKTPPANTAVWLDLMGGLTNNAESGIRKHVSRFGDNNLLFVTLAIGGAMRAFNEDNALVASTYKSSRFSRTMSTDLRLYEILVDAADNKKVSSVMQPYVYRRPKTTYGVFGYSVKII